MIQKEGSIYNTNNGFFFREIDDRLTFATSITGNKQTNEQKSGQLFLYDYSVTLTRMDANYFLVVNWKQTVFPIPKIVLLLPSSFFVYHYS
jgi:hypothetical protein